MTYEKVQVRHDATIEITITPKWGPLPGRTEQTKAYLLDEAITQLSLMYVGVSGYVIGSASMNYRIVDGVLAEGEECDCEEVCGVLYGRKQNASDS